MVQDRYVETESEGNTKQRAASVVTQQSRDDRCVTLYDVAKSDTHRDVPFRGAITA